MYEVVLIPGDGIGPEVIDSAIQVIEATGVKIKWKVVQAGQKTEESEGTPLPNSVLDAIRETKVALKGPITTPIAKGFRSVNVRLRRELDLYAALRPVRSFHGAFTRYEDIDLVIIRENTEGLYSGVEHWVDKERKAAESIRIITRHASERIIKYAFEYARLWRRKKVTLVHKANILKATCGLFLEVGKEVSSSYPEIEFEDRIVDNMAMQLVKKPSEYDVIVTSNLFGDILSDLCAGLIGGLGLAPGANIGQEIAVFEPVHGSAPKYAGKNKVNPTSSILSGALMLFHLGEREAYHRIYNGVKEVIREGKVLTYDLGGTSSMSQMTEAIVERVRGG
ncbi:MAG: isocitrate/isopropylmalate dehydrogenase family protein [bacterium]|nr:isocitrate/isopropylmalate dehydrogenase family protein [bacterium]